MGSNGRQKANWAAEVILNLEIGQGVWGESDSQESLPCLSLGYGWCNDRATDLKFVPLMQQAATTSHPVLDQEGQWEVKAQDKTLGGGSRPIYPIASVF